MPKSSSSSSKPKFFDGQFDFGSSLFDEGGYFQSLLSGAPDPTFMRQMELGGQQTAEQLAGQGLSGTGLASRAIADQNTQATFGMQDNLFNKLMQSIQPAGTTSVGGSSGLFTK